MSLAGTGLSLSIDGRPIVDSATFDVPSGSLVALVGPNGAGKSTLLRMVAGVQQADVGSVHLDGQPLSTMSRRRRARQVALVEQDAHAEFALTVRQAVELGRVPFQSIWTGPGVDDRSVVDAALTRTGARAHESRSVSTLSGGEQQRVHLARALAQEPRLLLVDEPTNHLDIKAQLHTLSLLSRLTTEGVSVVAALHDLNLAAAYCDHVVVLASGRVRAVGPVQDVLRADLIEEVYAVTADVLCHPRTGRPLIAFGEPGRPTTAGEPSCRRAPLASRS